MDCKVRLAFFRLLYVLFVAAVAGTVYFLPDCFTDRYFTSGQLWVCGCAGLAGVVAALGGRLRCSRLGAVVGVALFAGWGYGFAAGYLGGQALACGVSLWLVLLVAEGSAGKVSYRDVYFVVALSLGVEAAVGLGQFAGWWHSGSSFRVTGTFDNPAGLAAYAAVCFPCALHFLRSPRWGARAYGGAVALLAVAAVVASGSRAGMAALAAAGALWGWQAWGWQARRARWWLAGMAVAGILAGVWLYHWKKDSADGRLLVWRCTWEMMADAPVAGHAPGSFQAKYMGYQAAFLERHAGGRQGWLADNVKHPFNEYLKVGAECGVAGLAALAVVLWWLWRCWRRSRGERQPLFLGVAGVAVCGLFSYPLNYPGVVAVLFLLLGLTGRGERGVRLRGWGWRALFALLSLGLVAFAGYWGKQEARWQQLSRQALRGGFGEAEAGYRELYPFLRENPLFLYNYGAELHHAGKWGEAAAVLEACAEGLDDTDVQMLLGNACEQSGDDAGAEGHFRQAAMMCPVRFMPLYRLVRLYERTGRQEEALRLAGELVEKPVKVPSYAVEKIKRECRELLEKGTEKGDAPRR